jgi:hypothetical protein
VAFCSFAPFPVLFFFFNLQPVAKKKEVIPKSGDFGEGTLKSKLPETSL